MEPDNRFSRRRVAAALVVGLVGACLIWVAVPLNNYLLKNSFIADNYMPEIVLALLALSVLAVNPLLDLIRPAWRLTRRQLALVLGIWLMAAVVPGSGLMGMLPYSLARATQAANTDMALAEAHRAMPLPSALFPDHLQMGKETPVSDGLLGRQEPDTPIPWRQWLPPLAAWGPLILAAWLMMIGLGMIVYPQWRERERLSFPLLTMYEALIEPPEEGRHFPPVLRERLFWTGALTILTLHSFNGLNLHTGGRFPGFPFSWNLWHIFQDDPWRNAPWSLRGGQLYFTLVGIVYFMPNRISFSIWSGIIAFAIYLMLKWTYFPMQGTTTSELDFKTGAWLAYGLGILWLGRAHWRQVTRAMFSRSPEGTVVRDRAAGWFFFGGIAAMFGWFLWAGISAGASAGYVLFGVLMTLLVTRVVSESGLPLLNFSPFVPSRFISMFPREWWSAAAVYLGGYVGILFNYGARICAAVMSCLSMGLDRERSPREQPRVAYLLLVVLVAGVFVAGAVHLQMAYRHETTLDGNSPIAGMARSRMGEALRAVSQFHAGSPFTPPTAERWPRFIGGMTVAALLQAGCLTFPRWPIHPIALLFVGSFVGDAMWPSIFLGWLLKTLITTYGGARGYRAARPLFLGLVLGEVFAVIIWTIVPVVLILTGSDPATVGRSEILLSM